jgi:pilus assembly protein CpaC
MSSIHNKLCVILVLGLAVLWPSLGAAQQDSLEVELNEGQLIRLERPAASVFIANPEVADVSVKSPRIIYVFGRKPGETTFFAVDENENVVASRSIEVAHNISRLNEALSTLIADGQVTATSVDGGIVLTGAVASPSDADNAKRVAARFLAENEEVINRLAVTEPNQVNLRVRVAEVSKEIMEQFGINWEVAFQDGFTLGLATLNPVVSDAIGLSPRVNFGSDPFFLTRGSPGLSNAFLGVNSGDFDLNTLIDLLAEDGLVTLLAEPNLTAVSGETASFLAGGEFPIPIAQDDNELTIQFKKFGVSLSFTPTVLDGNRISMRVRPEVSQLSNQGAITIGSLQIPALSTRRAETTVELGSGQSFAIAGLLLDSSRQDFAKVPGFGDLPILGPLFRSNRFQRNETELAIVVTPYLVRPVSDERIPLPTDPTIGERPGISAVVADAAAPHTIPVPSPAPMRQSAVGPGGFIIE